LKISFCFALRFGSQYEAGWFGLISERGLGASVDTAGKFVI
jgi:hypothetical protein